MKYTAYIFCSITATLYADTVLVKNARIYTLDETNPWVDSLEYDTATGLITSVGEADGTSADKTIDLGGRFVMPGIHDAHLHVVEAGLVQQICQLDQDAAFDDLGFYFVLDPEFCPTGGPFVTKAGRRALVLT